MPVSSLHSHSFTCTLYSHTLRHNLLQAKRDSSEIYSMVSACRFITVCTSLWSHRQRHQRAMHKHSRLNELVITSAAQYHRRCTVGRRNASGMPCTFLVIHVCACAVTHCCYIHYVSVLRLESCWSPSPGEG